MSIKPGIAYNPSVLNVVLLGSLLEDAIEDISFPEIKISWFGIITSFSTSTILTFSTLFIGLGIVVNAP